MLDADGEPRVAEVLQRDRRALLRAFLHLRHLRQPPAATEEQLGGADAAAEHAAALLQ